MTAPSKNGLYIGLMCGTSADAIDAALVRWTETEQPELLQSHSHALPAALRDDLLKLNNNPNTTLRALSLLDTQVAQSHAAAVQSLLTKASLSAGDISAIGFHGQTVDHAPHSPTHNTTQIGNAHLLAASCDISVIADVRRADIAVGGQGAPLAPALHAQLLRNPDHDSAVVNIGGIANLSLLPANPVKAVRGFDTGPGNCLMDEWAKQHLGKNFDPDGQFAASGDIHTRLIESWLSHGYFHQPIPKSTGRDLFNQQWLSKSLHGENGRPADVQASLAELTAVSIATELKRHLGSTGYLYVCGGGAHNGHLMKRLQHHLPQCEVLTTAARGIDPDWMEAILMAWIARQYCLNKTSNLPSVTGARSSVRLGVRYDPPSAFITDD